MPFDVAKLICVAGNAQASQWAYRTTDRPAEVLAPGYFPDDRRLNFMLPGEMLTLTCWPSRRRGRQRDNPTAVLQAVTARTTAGVWLVLPLTPMARPEWAAGQTGRHRM